MSITALINENDSVTQCRGVHSHTGHGKRAAGLYLDI